MSELIKTLIERRANTFRGMQEVLERAESENRDPSVEEQTDFEARTAELDRIDQRIETLTKAAQRDADITASFRSLNEREQQNPREEERRGDGPAVASQLRSMFSGETRGFEIKPSKATDVATPEARALSKLTAGAGGNLVYPTFYDRLFEHMIETSAIMSRATIMRTATGEPIVMPKVTSFSTAALVAELGTIPQSDPAFAQATLSAYKYGVMLQLSHELINDTGFDLEGFVSRQAGRAVGMAFDAHLMNGTGTNQPTGLMTSVTVGKTGGTGVGGAFTVDDLIDLKYSVTTPYRPGAGWMMRDSSVGAMRKLKSAQGVYLWEPGLQVGAPNRFDGDPVYAEMSMPAVALNANSVLYGDYEAYTVRLVEAMRFERSTDFAFNTDAETYRCLLRGDGFLLDTTGAIKAFKGGAS